jgi:hypothetical protein
MSDTGFNCNNCTFDELKSRLATNTRTIEESSETVAKAKLSNEHLAPIVDTIERQSADFLIQKHGEDLYKKYTALKEKILIEKTRLESSLNAGVRSKIDEGLKSLTITDTSLSNEYAEKEINFVPKKSLEVKEANRKVLIADQHFTNHFYSSLEQRVKEVSERFEQTKELQESNLTEQAVKYADLYICDQQLSVSTANADHQTTTEIINFPKSEDDYTRTLVKYGCDLFQHRISLDEIRLQAEKEESDFETLRANIEENKKTQKRRIRELAETTAKL